MNVFPGRSPFETTVLVGILILNGLGCNRAPAPVEQLAQVTGQVLWNGKPLEGAEVVFEPDHGASSIGFTDANGMYELKYNTDYDGALIGQHTVRIRKMGGPDTEFDTVNLLPENFNERSTLQATVSAEPNIANFDLASR